MIRDWYGVTSAPFDETSTTIASDGRAWTAAELFAAIKSNPEQFRELSNYAWGLWR